MHNPLFSKNKKMSLLEKYSNFSSLLDDILDKNIGIFFYSSIQNNYVIKF